MLGTETDPGRELPGIRPANIGECERLTSMSVAATRDYGHDEPTMSLITPWLRIPETLVAAGLVSVADENGLPAGVLVMRPSGVTGIMVVDKLFVESAFQRRGIGSRLFKAAARKASALEHPVLLVYAYSGAEGFYLRQGLRAICSIPFPPVPKLVTRLMVGLARDAT